MVLAQVDTGVVGYEEGNVLEDGEGETKTKLSTVLARQR